MAWWREFGYFPPSRPRAAKGGIRAQSRGGRFGESWWARRWIEVLEGFNIGARLQRGRSYARRGQVLSVAIAKGAVSAKVQGSRPTPYQVSIKVAALSKAEWKRLAEILGGKALFVAKLLAGEMPQEIEEAFRDAGLSLFPEAIRDLETECSCPDWSNPCKHIAAVYYLLGEEFDRDPFLIFKLRGMERNELIGLIGGGPKAERKDRGAKAVRAHGTSAEESTPAGIPLPSDPGAFWGKEAPSEESFGEVRIPAVPAALVKRLGSFPFWRGEENFVPALERVYRGAAAVGMDVFLGVTRDGLALDPRR
ncbi:MAG TPA: SWIM zinc finger family protein [Candidatus Methylomirabilis sp.]|nr:SWIM zinc finger family protein [Candidatus Methylomirabilis sp.]